MIKVLVVEDEYIIRKGNTEDIRDKTAEKNG